MIPKVYIIAGPTAVGKTAVAIRVAQLLGTEIVSADSRQCYREMTIGTAKPSPVELRAVKHHFIDEFPVTQALTAADYEVLALQYIEDIFKTHNTAVVCGGTGLYIKALCEGLDEMPETDHQVVAEVEKTYKHRGVEWLKQAVHDEDPEFYDQGEIENPARMMRALSFVRSTGKSILRYRTGARKERPFQMIKVGLELQREELYERINHRVDTMMEEGLLAEAQGLYSLRHLKNLQTVGYAELFEYIDGKYTLKEAVTKIKQHTRNYAKRQITWFKKDKDITWFNAKDTALPEKIFALTR